MQAKPGFHRNANRPKASFIPAGEEGCRSGGWGVSVLPEWVPQDLGGWVKVALQRGTTRRADRPHAAGGDRVEGGRCGSVTL